MGNADKKQFLKKLTVLIDTREQENKHITSALDSRGVAYEVRKLDFGDYSFVYDGKDFSMACAVERKANVEELYGNIMHDRGRIEKEFYSASCLANEFTLMIEDCENFDSLRDYKLSAWQMKANPQRQVQDIGKHVYSTIRAWKCSDRYNFSVEFSPKKTETASRMLELFYYYWHSYKELTASRRKQ